MAAPDASSGPLAPPSATTPLPAAPLVLVSLAAAVSLAVTPLAFAAPLAAVLRPARRFDGWTRGSSPACLS